MNIYYIPYKCGQSGIVVSKQGLYADGPGLIPTAITTRTAAGGDAEHVSLITYSFHHTKV